MGAKREGWGVWGGAESAAAHREGSRGAARARAGAAFALGLAARLPPSRRVGGRVLVRRARAGGRAGGARGAPRGARERRVACRQRSRKFRGDGAVDRPDGHLSGVTVAVQERGRHPAAPVCVCVCVLHRVLGFVILVGSASRNTHTRSALKSPTNCGRAVICVYLYRRCLQPYCVTDDAPRRSLRLRRLSMPVHAPSCAP